MTLTESQKSIIKSTVPLLQEHGATVTAIFYNNMLAAHTELKTIFNAANQAHMAQPKALAGAVLAYAQHIEDPSVLLPTIELICHKHASLLVRPEHYPIVGEFLLGAMGEVLGDLFTEEVKEAWALAYGDLADIFINTEKGLYKSANGWTEWREMKIVKKVKESEEITSFWLAPIDGKELPQFKPGQYISVQVDVPALGHAQARQYSLSDAPAADHYRISVKRETGVDARRPLDAANAPGLISTLLHETKEEGDTVRISHPMGNFFLDGIQAAESTPVVLISGGVGLTALTSILNSLVELKSTRPISWVHAARTADVRAFGKEVRDISRTSKNVKGVFFDANAKVDEKLDARPQNGFSSDTHTGRLDLSQLHAEEELFLHDKQTEYYVCGPVSFMTDMEKGLRAYGVEATKIHMEKFGVGGVPRSA